MAVNFRLAYNQGFEYVDLFPSTSVEAIKEGSVVARQSVVNITIPSINNYTQTIPLSLTQEQLNSMVYMQLIDLSEDDQYNYDSISQYQITNDGLVINRLYYYPTDSIQVALIFVENGSNVLNYSELTVTIPVSSDFLQSIPITVSDSQVLSPVYMELIGSTSQELQDYYTIRQFEVTNNALNIWRFDLFPTNEIQIKLTFKQGGVRDAN